MWYSWTLLMAVKKVSYPVVVNLDNGKQTLLTDNLLEPALLPDQLVQNLRRRHDP